MHVFSVQLKCFLHSRNIVYVIFCNEVNMTLTGLIVLSSVYGNLVYDIGAWFALLFWETGRQLEDIIVLLYNIWVGIITVCAKSCNVDDSCHEYVICIQI